MNTKRENQDQAWVVTVDMGYGHQRTAYPLKFLAPEGKLINANCYLGISKKDRWIWESIRIFYEFISNFKNIPFVGEMAFSFFDSLHKITSFYPKRDLSRPNLELKFLFFLMKMGWGKHLIDKMGGRPIISTFFMPAFMAEYFNYPAEIFIVICDADIARSWVSIDPASSKIKYLVPTSRAVERLRLYGAKQKNIYLTGYPLPLENIGSENMEILKNDLGRRLLNLDPKGVYFKEYETLVKKYLGKLPERLVRPLTLLFSVGGAGAQKDIAVKVLKSLSQKIKNQEIKMILSAGTREKSKEYFEKYIKDLGLNDCLGKSIEIIFAENTDGYFEAFNRALRTTDILWTKPSELSFYSALGLPIIMAPPVGSQEDCNKKWLLRLGSGIPQGDPKYADLWLFDLLNSGWFAEAAMQGFIEGEKLGTFKIKNIIKTGSDEK
ncbi:MAG: hypothetical protein AAB621_03960 [Patescibacteria group bacterium]